MAVTLRAHDPDRTLERGFALAETAAGEPVGTAEGAVAAAEVRLRFADGRVKAQIERLEEIIDRLDSGQAGLRETLELCREGRELVNYCAAELEAVGEGLKELKLDEPCGEAGGFV
jgi:exodeoxyribonuclease VII small subunit